ncbi:MAG: radical SAM protein [Bacteroidota bacterium]|nr:radical SAM protein [Bacteroidota bacterium]
MSNGSFDTVLIYPKESLSIFENIIPLGLATIAAVLEENGISVKIVDLTLYRGNLIKDLQIWQPSVIGVSGTTVTRKGSFNAAKLSKKALPGTQVVYGGVHATFAAEDTLENISEIDYIIKGEGEYPFLKLCQCIINGESEDIFSISGLSYRRDGKIFHNKAERINDLDKLPPPARHLFDKKYGLKLDFYDLDADFIMTSRGCPAACTFCSASKMFPGGVRTRSAELIKPEIESLLKNKDIKALKIFDSTFTAKREHVLEFCEMITEFDLKWECEIRADTVDKELLTIMRDAGCCYIDVGMETVDPVLLTNLHKNVDVEQLEQVLVWCRELTIKAKVFFIFGHPGQSFGSCLKDLDYIKKNRKKIDYIAASIGMRIYPGTRIEAIAREKGIIAEDFSWARYKPPFSNLLMFEYGDVMVLRQKGLTTIHFLTLIVLLVVNRLIAPFSYYRKIVIYNLQKLLG